ncbi:CaiB/BaiF CoA transferase family protein [Aeromicrobium wangtongii]|uniref:CaiB/BaiF CoA transferase family protein n=1 Tax=Aeromicrobium wangtongii TaxID=2969247 RepID=UPI00201715C5|nr:CoA transferase [Aeromicrobium wangtongii]MCL3816965.1 CoA transferase [Aeromicrobium wangtongii]
MTALLDGVVVADFSRVLAGPLATSMLADLGATVVKVERPLVGDDTRHWGPPWTESSSAYFDCANRSKESVELDLDDPADHAVAMALMESADVVVENFRPGALAAKGLGYTDVAARNRGVVYCSISGFGSREGAALPGYDFLVQAVGGLMSITGPEDSEPSKVGVALVDVLTSKDAVIGILAALNERHSSGSGQHIEVNLLSSLLGSLANQSSSYLATGTVPGRMGNRHPSIAPYETLHCQDGIIAVCCGNDGQFGRLAQVIGEPRLAADPRFASNADRVANRPELVAELEAALGTHPAAHWIPALTAAGVPAGAVGDIGSAFRLAADLGLEPRVDVGPHGINQVRHPITYSRTPVETYRRPPRLGEHNDAVRARYTQKTRTP